MPALFTAVLLALPILFPPRLAAATLEDRMVAEQVEARGIDDARVLRALRAVPRSAFVPAGARAHAHDDSPLPIGHGQTISQPYIVGLMTQLLDVRPEQRVLEIGTGSGYQAAVLAELVREVYSIEIVPELAARARLALTRQGYRNVHVKLGDGAHGWKEYAPFDRIIVTAAGSRVPPNLVDQLVEGGVLVMPIGEENAKQTLVKGVKRDGKLHARPITEVRFVPLTGSQRRGPSRRPPPLREDPEAPPKPADDRPEPAHDRPGLSEEDLSSSPESGRRSHSAAPARAPRGRGARARGDRAGSSRDACAARRSLRAAA
jgi:protein-L-isoaspartate(D-aspartate) O-methyltransferase